MVRFFSGLDLGQSSDYTALAIIESISDPEPSYNLRRLERVRGLSYPDVVRKVAGVVRSKELAGNVMLAIDYSGIGRAVYDLFVQDGLHPIAVTSTGGNAIHHEGDEWSIPKRDLVSSLQVALQCGKLHFSEKLKHASTLRSELLNFSMKISDSGHDSYEAKKGHDDLVLSLALCTWYASRQSGSRSTPIDFSVFQEEIATPGFLMDGYPQLPSLDNDYDCEEGYY
ncbi:MAG: hypothetical protein WB392_09665 [Methanotrichaceae archaeon]